MPFEDQFARSLRDTGEEFAPRDLTSLVNGAVTDGRRRRRRRNTAVVGGSAALALVAVGTALVPSVLGAPGTARHVADAAAAPSISLTAAAQPESDKARAQQMVITLEHLLPKGAKITDAVGRWSFPAPGGKAAFVAPTASLVYDDGRGASAIGLSLARYAKGGAQLPTCGNPAYVPHDVCHVYQLPGGGRLLIDQGYEYPSRGTGTKDWHAVLDLPDGSHVEMDEWNAPAEKGAAVTRATPPLSADQLKAVVTSGSWQPLLAAVPKPKPVKSAPVPPSGAAILTVLNSLLPHGVSGRNSDVQGGYAEEQLTDGSPGAGLIGVNVQQYDPSNDSDLIAQLYGGATKLPDGSLVAVRQQNAEKGGSGAVQWVVDMLRPNGERVVAQEFNAPRQGVAADRAEPVLSIAQLKAVVTDVAWTKLG
ncbi:hypothetical protein [Streptacidiphilus anmyonensis]|uniref:hypothetical protein n=1 Tax=Streptacidiphilus anmyonensis TaxID=405782 RepID=UPI0005AAD373|nr:hypothetical protein [Streptacidiphilus anmyonensis]